MWAWLPWLKWRSSQMGSAPRVFLWPLVSVDFLSLLLPEEILTFRENVRFPLSRVSAPPQSSDRNPHTEPKTGATQGLAWSRLDITSQGHPALAAVGLRSWEPQSEGFVSYRCVTQCGSPTCCSPSALSPPPPGSLSPGTDHPCLLIPPFRKGDNPWETQGKGSPGWGRRGPQGTQTFKGITVKLQGSLHGKDNQLVKCKSRWGSSAFAWVLEGGSVTSGKKCEGR